MTVTTLNLALRLNWREQLDPHVQAVLDIADDRADLTEPDGTSPHFNRRIDLIVAHLGPKAREAVAEAFHTIAHDLEWLDRASCTGAGQIVRDYHDYDGPVSDPYGACEALEEGWRIEAVEQAQFAASILTHPSGRAA